MANGLGGSPNRIVQTYFGIARRMSDHARSASNESVEREYTYLAVLTSVAAVEAFLNIWCQTFTELEPHLKPHRPKIMEDLEKRKGVKHALKSWPVLLFGRGIDLGSGNGQRFVSVLNLRNNLMHATTTLDTYSIDLGGHGTITLQGLNSPEAYESLNASIAAGAIRAAVGVVREFFGLFETLGGTPPEGHTHGWTGITPAEQDEMFAS